MFQKIVELDRNDFDAWVGLGSTKRELGNDLYTSATMKYETARLKPSELSAAQQEVDLAAEHHRQSKLAFEQALVRRPKDPQAIYGLGTLYLNRASGVYRLFTENEQDDVDSHFVAAVKCFEMVIGQTPSPSAHRNLGFAYLGVNRREEARTHFEQYLARLEEMKAQMKGLRLGNKDEKAQLEQQKMLVRKDIADTRALIERCELPPPASSFLGRQTLALNLLERGRAKEAREHLEPCLKIARDLQREWNDCAPKTAHQEKLRTQELKRMRKAIEDLQKGIQDCVRALR